MQRRPAEVVSDGQLRCAHAAAGAEQLLQEPHVLSLAGDVDRAVARAVACATIDAVMVEE